MQEAGFLQPDIDESGLHPGKYASDFAFVEITYKALPLVALQMELGQDAVFEQPYPHFEGRGVDYNFAFHGNALPDDRGSTGDDTERVQLLQGDSGPVLPSIARIALLRGGLKYRYRLDSAPPFPLID